MTKREAFELYLGLGIAIVAILAVLLVGRYVNGECLAGVVTVFLGVFLVAKLGRAQ